MGASFAFLSSLWSASERALFGKIVWGSILGEILGHRGFTTSKILALWGYPFPQANCLIRENRSVYQQVGVEPLILPAGWE